MALAHTPQAPPPRGVYSFCMCPGGQIVPTSLDEGRLCVNGMSYSNRGSRWANSAVVASVGQQYGDYVAAEGADGAETGADPNTARLGVDVFAATRGGAEKMCADHGVPFLGRVPLDPAIAAAAERGASLFDDAHTAHAGAGGTGASYAAVRAVVDGVRAAIGEA